MIEKMMWIVLSLACFILSNANGFRIKRCEKHKHHLDQAQTLIYLYNFGYMDPVVANPRSSRMISSNTYGDAIKNFQSMVGLPKTGVMDHETMTMMESPRCGVHDKFKKDDENSNRKKRFVIQGSRWKNKHVTYKIHNYPSNVSRQDVDAQIALSFEVWSEVAAIKFRHVKDNKESANIEILFAEGDHGDEDPFDGPGGTLGHAFFPLYGGDVHFDNAEKWTVKGYKGTNLFQVASHEIGHSLGLGHSSVSNAMMAPVYRDMSLHMSLHDDDIQGIIALYGPAEDGPVKGGSIGKTNKIDEESLKLHDMCGSQSFDAMVTTHEGVTFVFRGTKMYKLYSDGIEPGYPREISEQFPGLPNDIDAAFTWSNGRTYIFKGTEYWRMTNQVVDNNYPKKIAFGFPGIPDDIDAAVVWSGNLKVYFFKGNDYWKFEPNSNPQVEVIYPQPISKWNGIPISVEAATQYKNGFTYFFKGGNYWRFNDDHFSVDQFTEGTYERRTDKWWFGCEDLADNIRMNHSEKTPEQPSLGPLENSDK